MALLVYDVQVGIVRHGADLGVIPVVVTDACSSVDQAGR
jgi:nicotinamidase-related amidase